MNRTHWISRGHRDRDQGAAMVTTVMVSMVMMIASVSAYSISRHSFESTSRNLKRTLSVSTAEAGLDIAMSQLTVAPLPCSLTGTTGTAPQTGSYAVTVEYYPSHPISGSPMVCDAATGPADIPAAAHLLSVGTTDGSIGRTRTMEALVRMTLLPSGAIDKGIFAEASIVTNNRLTVYGNVGNDADLYTNGNFTCNNNQTVQGSVYAQGSITAHNSCTALVDYYAKGDVKTYNSVTVGHDMKSSQGNIDMSSKSEVGHDAIAAGTNIGGTVGNNRVSGADLQDPPASVFPTIEFDADAWTAAGFTRQLLHDDCTEAMAVIAGMNTATEATVLQTSCALVWNNTNTISLNADLAVFSTGGFTMNNTFTAQSTDSMMRRYMMIVPTSAWTSDPNECPGISAHNQTSFASTVNVFWYTPCTITASNSSGGYGQMYGGTVNITNHFTLHYTPVTVPGVLFETNSPETYRNDLIYKRETL